MLEEESSSEEDPAQACVELQRGASSPRLCGALRAMPSVAGCDLPGSGGDVPWLGTQVEECWPRSLASASILPL